MSKQKFRQRCRCGGGGGAPAAVAWQASAGFTAVRRRQPCRRAPGHGSLENLDRSISAKEDLKLAALYLFSYILFYLRHKCCLLSSITIHLIPPRGFRTSCRGDGASATTQPAILEHGPDSPPNGHHPRGKVASQSYRVRNSRKHNQCGPARRSSNPHNGPSDGHAALRPEAGHLHGRGEEPPVVLGSAELTKADGHQPKVAAAGDPKHHREDRHHSL